MNKNIRHRILSFAVIISLVAAVFVYPLTQHTIPVYAEEYTELADEETAHEVNDGTGDDEEQSEQDESEQDESEQRQTGRRRSVVRGSRQGQTDDEQTGLEETNREQTDQTDPAVNETRDYTAIWNINRSGTTEVENGKAKIKITDGMADPIINYQYNTINTTDVPSEKYKNTFTVDDVNDADHGKTFFRDILRFCVYVETDLDTDMDGMADLVMAHVQVPTAAVFGDYKAPTIFHASPYMAGCSDSKRDHLFNRSTEPDLAESSLLREGTKRTASDTEWSTQKAAEMTNPDDWIYKWPLLSNETKDDELGNNYYLNALHDQDYFLVRGFAVVSSAGLGTWGSEGFETCGSMAERDAFKNIIEWIHGDRKAYTDKENNIPIKATDWANGKVAMEGLSYDGTLAYEVATTGVEGLATVVPEAGIASWYDYTNTQGLNNYYSENENGTRDVTEYDYTTQLASSNASRFFDSIAASDVKTKYQQYLGYLRRQQIALKGMYGTYWEGRDHTYLERNSKPEMSARGVSALIVQGVRDYNVKTKQADLMMKTFEANGVPYKVLLHQGTHDTPDHMKININGRNYYYHEILNLWFCHYLLGTANGMPDTLPDVLAQSNIDGTFSSVGKWGAGDYNLIMKYPYSGETLISRAASNAGSGNGSEGGNEGTQTPGNRPDDADPDENAKYSIDVYRQSLGDTFDSGSESTEQQEGEPEPDSQPLISIERKITKDLTINGSADVHVRIAVKDTSKDILMAGAMLYDFCDTEFESIIPNSNGDVEKQNTEGDVSIVMGGNLEQQTEKEYKRLRAKEVMISKGMINLRTPGAGYNPRSATAPSTPIADDTYYDYVIHLLPTVYTIKSGHKLVLYIMPEMDFTKSDSEFLVQDNSIVANIPLCPPESGGTPSEPEITTAPRGVSGLIYDGEEHELVLDGEVTGGELYYALGNENGPTEPYKRALPKGRDAGTYHVWYRSFAIDEYTESDGENRLPVTIAKRRARIIANDQTVNTGGSIATGVSRATFNNPATGHALSAVTLTASSTAAATTNGTITPSNARIIISGTTTDVTANYDIEYVAGRLTVNENGSGGGSSTGGGGSSGSGGSSGGSGSSGSGNSSSGSSSSESSSSSSSSSGGSSDKGSSSGGGSVVGNVNYDGLRAQFTNAITAINTQKLTKGAAGVTQQMITWDKGEALPYFAMKTLQDNPNITLVFKCTYKGMDYAFAIPGSKVRANPLVQWYGPLYLLAYYGQFAMASPANSGIPMRPIMYNVTLPVGAKGVYTVKAGDTLAKLAKRLNTTVDNLVKLNGIRNRNIIKPGQVLKY